MEMVNVEELFASKVFTLGKMKERLPKGTFKEVNKIINEGGELSKEAADVVAKAMKDWAVENGATHYKVFIHINGNYKIGSYASEASAAVAYNKAADLAKTFGVTKQFPENYVDTLNPREYAELYTHVKISKKYIDYLKTFA